MADRMIVIVPDGADKLLQTIETFMLGWATNNASADSLSTPSSSTYNNTTTATDAGKYTFEAYAYEALLTIVLDLENEEFTRLDERANKLLQQYSQENNNIPLHIQCNLLSLKDALDSKEIRVLAHKRAITDLLEDDERMALMNLTRLKHKPLLYKCVTTTIDQLA